jgi:hypothetical protein
MRVGVIATNDDGSDDTALTATRLPAPNVTATAAPTAAQRDRHAREPTRVVIVIVVCPISWSAQTQSRTRDPSPYTPSPTRQTPPDVNQPSPPINSRAIRPYAHNRASRNAPKIARVPAPDVPVRGTPNDAWHSTSFGSTNVRSVAR